MITRGDTNVTETRLHFISFYSGHLYITLFYAWWWFYV